MKVFNKLDINPTNMNLYMEAVTHSSFTNENPNDPDYERLELDIRVGTGEEINQTILADVFEAFVAALYLDQGFEFTRSFVLNIILKYIEKEVDFLHDYKSTLQELAQTVKKSIIYEVVDEEGPAHNKKFTSIVKVDGIIMGRGTAGSKKASEQEAAKDALSKRAGIK